MITLVLEAEPNIIDLVVNKEKLLIDLEDGRSLIIPISWYPRLLHGTPVERQNWQLLGDGYAIECLIWTNI